MNKPASELIALADAIHAWQQNPATTYTPTNILQDHGDTVVELARTAANQSGSERAGVDVLREALRTAVGHIEHMAAHIREANVDYHVGRYSFESLGEDMPGIRAALATPPAQPAPASDESCANSILRAIWDDIETAAVETPVDNYECADIRPETLARLADHLAARNWKDKADVDLPPDDCRTAILPISVRGSESVDLLQPVAPGPHGKPDGAVREALDDVGVFFRLLRGPSYVADAFSLNVTNAEYKKAREGFDKLKVALRDATEKVDWTPFEDGTAPWSEDEQFEERAKACKSRCKQYGYTCGQGGEEDYEYEGECDDCDRDAQEVLRKKYLKPPGDVVAMKEACKRAVTEQGYMYVNGVRAPDDIPVTFRSSIWCDAIKAAVAAIDRLDVAEAKSEAVQDTWFTDSRLPVVAMSGDVESDHVLKLHFRRPVADQDRIDLTDAMNMKILTEAKSQEPEARRVSVPEGQTPLDDKLGHKYLDVFREGGAARDTGARSPYHGHSLEHCLHSAGWVQRDLRLALDTAKATAKPEATTVSVDAIKRIICGIYGIGSPPFSGGHQDRSINSAATAIAALISGGR